MTNNLDVIKVAFPNCSLEKQIEIHNFLNEQDWSEIEEITNCMLVLSPIIRDYPSIKLLFDKNIKVEPWGVQVSCTREQIQDASAMGMSFVSQIMGALITNMTDEIKSQLKDQTTYILVTNRKFISAVNMNEEQPYKIFLTLNANFKVLTIKDLRRLKIKQINEKII